jgi:hypothetical protein
MSRKKIRNRRSRRSSRSEVPRLRITCAEDFVVLVPYLLGFHPTDSIVALFYRRRQIQLTARFDLPPPGTAPMLSAELTKLAQRARAEGLVLVAYSDDPAGRQLMERLLPETDVDLFEALLVGSDRWWSLVCDQECCPPEGTAYDPASHPVAAEAVLAGLSAAPSRAAVGDLVAGPADSEIPELERLASAELERLAALDRASRQLRMCKLVTAALADPGRLRDDACVELAALCSDVLVRDVAWALITREQADAHLDLWRRVVSKSVDQVASGPLGLTAIAAWVSGGGALLNCCIARMEEVDPDYSLLEILQDISARAIPPSSWETIRRDMSPDPRLLVS